MDTSDGDPCGRLLKYLPPEPVDVVIVKMIHSAMLRKSSRSHRGIQRSAIETALATKTAGFFIPEAFIMAVNVYSRLTIFSFFMRPFIQFQRIHAFKLEP